MKGGQTVKLLFICAPLKNNKEAVKINYGQMFEKLVCSHVFANMPNSTNMKEVGFTFSHFCDLVLHKKFGKHQEVLF